MLNTYSKMFEKLKDPEYRNLFNSRQIQRLLPMQIKALRVSREMKQEEMAKALQTTQTVVSRIERAKGNLTINTLLKIAEAFDVALVVRFDPINKFIDWVDDLSESAIAPEKSQTILKNMETAAREPK